MYRTPVRVILSEFSWQEKEPGPGRKFINSRLSFPGSMVIVIMFKTGCVPPFLILQATGDWVSPS
jgi:hypothetical protein